MLMKKTVEMIVKHPVTKELAATALHILLRNVAKK